MIPIATVIIRNAPLAHIDNAKNCSSVLHDKMFLSCISSTRKILAQNTCLDQQGETNRPMDRNFQSGNVKLSVSFGIGNAVKILLCYTCTYKERKMRWITGARYSIVGAGKTD